MKDPVVVQILAQLVKQKTARRIQILLILNENILVLKEKRLRKSVVRGLCHTKDV